MENQNSEWKYSLINYKINYKKKFILKDIEKFILKIS